MKTCFVVSPIGADNSPIRNNADKLLRHIIEPVCKALEYEVKRVDQIIHTNSINDQIITNLKNADLVIADLTGNNPNVFFELGYRNALGKPTIQLATKDTELPFDVSTINTYFYDLTDLDNVDSVKLNLINLIKILEEQYSSDSTHSDSSKENPPSTFNAQIFNMLISIQRSINKLDESINNKDTTTMQTVVDSLVSKVAVNKPSVEEQAMSALFNQMFSEPHKMLELVDVVKKLNL